MRRRGTSSAAVAAALMLALSACGGGSESAPEADTSGSSQASSSSAASSSAPTAPVELGTVQETPTSSVVALEVNPQVRTDETIREALGDERWAGALVKSCLNEDAEADTFGWPPWTLRDLDGGVYESMSGTTGPRYPQPTYPDGRMLQPGSCFKGWIVFAVAKQTKIDTVVYEGAGVPEPLTWKVA